MANSFSTYTTVDTNKRTVLMITGALDANGESSNTKILGRNLTGALAVDANNLVLASAPGAVPRVNYRYSIARIISNVNIPGGYVTMQWSGANSPGTIMNLSGNQDFNGEGNLGTIQNTANGPTGNIIFNAVGAVANSSYNIIVEIHKDNRDFNAGQIQRPQDFNVRGSTP